MTQTILAVEDNDPNYHLLEQILTQQNYAVVRAKNGAEGLVKAAELLPNLILLDLRLPQMDGWQMARELRADPYLQHIPVIAVSVEVDPVADRQRALDAGCDAYVAKPFTIVDLVNIIARFLS